MLAMVGLGVLSGCVAEDSDTAQAAPIPPGQEGFLPGPGSDGQQGDSCLDSYECAQGLRCLRRANEQLCVQPCFGDDECASGLCNPIEGSAMGWCALVEAGDGSDDVTDPAPNPGDEQAPDPPTPPEEDEQEPDGPGDQAPEEDEEDIPDPEPPAEDSGKQPGLACDCDSDCASVDGAQGICVSGICMLRSETRCSSRGSQQECPAGSRCWTVQSGDNICYPDCGGFGQCDGTCDGDNSCVATNSMDCYEACGALCGRSGNPPGSGGEPDDSEPDTEPELDGECGSAEETEVWRLANQARADSGLPPYECDLAVAAVARDHSEDMALNGYFSHTNRQGQRPWDRMREAGISFRSAGENIAYGQRTPASVHNSWMNSSGHRRNILNSGFTHLGVGAYNHNGTWYWTQVFASY